MKAHQGLITLDDSDEALDIKRERSGIPTLNPPLAAGLTAKFYDNYVLEASHGVIVSSYQTGRNAAAVRLKVKGAVYSAYLDAKVCPVCAALDEAQVDVPGDAWSSINPPQHNHCRCLWIYVEEGEEGFQADPDPYAGLRDLPGGAGKALVHGAHENPELQARFEADIQREREAILRRKLDRAQATLEKQADAAKKEAALSPEEREARDRRSAAAQKGAETRARRQREADTGRGEAGATSQPIGRDVPPGSRIQAPRENPLDVPIGWSKDVPSNVVPFGVEGKAHLQEVEGALGVLPTHLLERVAGQVQVGHSNDLLTAFRVHKEHVRDSAEKYLGRPVDESEVDDLHSATRDAFRALIKNYEVQGGAIPFARDVFAKTDEYLRLHCPVGQTAIHEVGHVVRWAAYSDEKMARIFSRVTKSGRFPYEGASVNPEELFAASFELYVANPEVLRERSPLMYTLMRKRIFKGVEY